MAEELVLDGEMAVETLEIDFEAPYPCGEVIGAVRAFAHDEGVAFVGYIIGLVGARDGGDTHEGLASHVGETGIDGFGLDKGKMEVFLLQGEPEHHLDVLLVVGLLLDTLDEGLAQTVDELGVGGFVEDALQRNLDGTKHVGGFVEEVEVFLHHGLVVADPVVEGCQLADIEEFVVCLFACKEVDLDGVFGVASGLEGLCQLADLLGVIAYFLDDGLVGFGGFATLGTHFVEPT